MISLRRSNERGTSHAWLQVIRGAVTLNNKTLKAGDGAAISNEKTLDITAIDPAEILLFDLA